MPPEKPLIAFSSACEIVANDMEVNKISRSLWSLMSCSIYFLCPGPSGNQPLRTRSRWWMTSSMLQNEEKAMTPSIVDQIRWLTNMDAAAKSTPDIANIIQLFMPM